jgi:hypothetical protein
MPVIRKPRAGAYAQRRYRRGLRNWRARLLWICAAILGPPFVLGLAGLLLWHQALSWSAGALAGAAAALWFAIRDTPPSFVEHWRVGAEGERATEKALRPLERSGGASSTTCVFLAGTELAAWLQEQPSRLSEPAFEQIAEGIARIASEEPSAARPEPSLA